MGLSSGEVAEEVTGGSGPGAERALEANNQSPRAKREVRSSPELPCERRPRPAEPRRGTYPQRQPQHSAIAKKVRAPGCMRRSFRTHRLCAIPRGFTPGWYPLPRWGTPNASLFPEPPPPPRPHAPQHHHHNTSDQRRLFFLNGDHQTIPYRDMPPNHEAAAGSVRSEHRNVDILIPLARQRESPTGPNVPCERRTDPAEPRRQRALGTQCI